MTPVNQNRTEDNSVTIWSETLDTHIDLINNVKKYINKQICITECNMMTFSENPTCTRHHHGLGSDCCLLPQKPRKSCLQFEVHSLCFFPLNKCHLLGNKNLIHHLRIETVPQVNRVPFSQVLPFLLPQNISLFLEFIEGLATKCIDL